MIWALVIKMFIILKIYFSISFVCSIVVLLSYIKPIWKLHNDFNDKTKVKSNVF